MNLQLALFVARSRVVRNAAILMFVVGVIAVGVNGVVRMMQVPSWALAETVVGSADYVMQVPIDGDLPFADDGRADAVLSAAASVGAVGARIGYRDGVTQIDQIDQSGDGTLLIQQEWASDPFPDGYVLQSGRLPAGVREAVVSPRLASRFPIGSDISFFHGALPLKVVGVVEDQTSRFGELVAIDEGTLEAVSKRDPHVFSRFPTAFSPVLYWSGAKPGDVATAVSAVLGERSDTAGQLVEATESHRALGQSPAPRLVELDIVVILLPLTASVVVAWGMNRFLSRLRRTLIQLGVTRTVGSLYVTATVTVALGAVIGGIAGIVMVYLIRPLVAVVSPSVLSSPHGLGVFVALIAGITVVGTAVSLLAGRVGASGGRRRDRRVIRPWALAWVGGGALVVGFVLLQSSDTNTKFAAVVLIGAGFCLIFSLLLRFLPEGGDATSVVLAMRRVRGEGRGSTWTVAALSVLLSVGFALATLYSSDTSTVNQQIFAGVPVGQAYFEPMHADDQLLSELVQYLGAGEPVEFAAVDASPVDLDGLAMATGSVADVARLIDRPLSVAEREVLESGGALLTGSAPDDSLRLVTDDGNQIVVPGAVAEQLPASFRRYSGILLQRTADKAGFSLVRPTWVFTDLTAEQRQRVDTAPSELGFEAGWLEGYEQPDAYKVMDELVIILGAILVIGACVIIAYAAMTARAMRPRSAGLIAVGLGRGWLARATSAEIGLIVLLSVGIAVGSAVISVGVAIATGVMSLTLTVPWDLLGIVVATLILVAAVAAAVSTRRLRMVERQDRW